MLDEKRVKVTRMLTTMSVPRCNLIMCIVKVTRMPTTMSVYC
jgi:hypothetical protein